MPLDPLWQPVTQTHPDARARRSLGEKKHRLLGWMEEIFCINCGKSGGMISKDWARHVFNLCDECVGKWGALPLPEIPESVVRGHGRKE